MADFKGANPPGLTRLIEFASGQGVTISTLAGNLTMTLASPQFASYDPGGAHRDVTLPDTKGAATAWFVINAADAAENLVFKTPAGSTIVTANQNEAAIIMTDGTSWDGFAFTGSLV